MHSRALFGHFYSGVDQCNNVLCKLHCQSYGRCVWCYRRKLVSGGRTNALQQGRAADVRNGHHTGERCVGRVQCGVCQG